MLIVKKDINDLKPAAYNPRKDLKPGDKGYEKLKKMIIEFDYIDPIVWNKQTGNIVGGHQRLKILKDLEYTEVDVSVVDLPIEKEKALNIALNADINKWDFPALKDLLLEIDTGAFDIEITGFDQADLEKLIVQYDSKGKETKPIDKIRDSTLEALEPTEAELEILKDREIFVEFSGGKDSTAAAVWAKHFLPDQKTTLLYVDMGADYPGMATYLYEVSKMLNMELRVLRSKQDMITHFLRKGKWPHFDHPYCHEVLHNALDTEVGKYEPQSIFVARGGRLAEKARSSNKQKDRFIQIKRMKEYVYYQPLYFTDKDTSENILTQNNIPVWYGYTVGLNRTCCRCCPGQKPATYAIIKKEFPYIWEELKYLELKLGPGCWQDRLNNSGAGKLDDMVAQGERILAKKKV